MRPQPWILLLLVLVACACSRAAPPPADDSPATTGAVPGPATPAASPGTPPDPAATSPVPPSEVPQPSLPISDAPTTANEVDYSCTTDADCTVKNVGNCCGYYPACVNVDSPTFPERVAARCAEQGMSSICGFPEISACTCNDGQCQPATDGSTGGGTVL